MKFCNAPVREKIKDAAGLRQLAAQIALDFFFIQPAIYFPTYYIFKESIAGTITPPASAQEQKTGQGEVVGAPLVGAAVGVAAPVALHEGAAPSVVSVAMAKYRENIVQDNLGMCGFWLPMDLIIYSAPIHLRLPLNHGISFLWCCLLSVFRGGEQAAPTVALEGLADEEPI